MPHLLLLFYFYRFLVRWTASTRAVTFGFAAFALNYLGLGYATGVNKHTPAATVLFISFYYAYLLRNGYSDKKKHWIISGVLAGLAPTLDIPAVVFSLAIIIYLASYDRRKTLAIFIPAFVPPLLLHFFLTYLSTGSLVPIYLRKTLYQYPGSYWLKPGGIDAANEPKPIYFFHMILGHHGVLSMTPVLVLACWGLYRSIRRLAVRLAEALVVAAPLIMVTAWIGIFTKNYGGVCVGLRWLLFAIPLLFVFTAVWLEEKSSKIAACLLVALIIVGFLNLWDALNGPWSESDWHQWFKSMHMGSIAD